MKPVVALSSDRPNLRTLHLFELAEAYAESAVIITRESNREKIGELFKRPADEIAILLRELDDPTRAATELHSMLARRQMRVANWINVPDTMTGVFLHCVERLNLNFPFLEAYTKCRVKPIVRQLMRDAGISKMPFAVHDRHSDDPPISVAMPFVCKPIIGTASEGVEVVCDTKDWDRVRRNWHGTQWKDIVIGGFSPLRDILVEKKLSGEEIEIDGYVEQGRLTVCALGLKVHHYRKDIGFREQGGLTYRPFSLPIHWKNDEQLVAWTKNLLEAASFHSGTFHIEAMRNGDQVDLIEINPRPGGGGVCSIVKSLSGVDLMEECVRLWLGITPAASPIDTDVRSIFYVIRYPERFGTVTRVMPEGEYEIPLPGLNKSVGTWRPFVVANEQVRSVRREQYLGEIHVPNIEASHTRLCEMINHVSAWQDDQGFVEFGPDRTESAMG